MAKCSKIYLALNYYYSLLYIFKENDLSYYATIKHH